MITVNLYYTGKNGSARKYAEEMVSSGVADAIRSEEGNLRYEYFFPMEDAETVLLIDQWQNQEAIDRHHASPMMGQIAAGLSAREDRKNILFSSKLTLVVISIMQIIIVWIIGAGLGIDVKHIMTSNAFGQVLLLVTGLLYLMVGVKMFGTDR